MISMRCDRSCLALLGLALVAAAATGCSTAAGRYVGRYLEARALDLADVAPISVGAGYGLAANLRVTPFAGIGAGWAESWRAGMGDHRFGPIWWEKERGVPVWFYFRYEDYLGEERRIPGGHPYWWPETRRTRASSWIVFPGIRRGGELWIPCLPPYFMPVDWEWSHYLKWGVSELDWDWTWDILNCEASVFLGGAGLRVGFGPAHFVDFLLGWLTIDLAHDDPREPRKPVWPDPDAAPSFPDAGASSETKTLTNE